MVSTRSQASLALSTMLIKVLSYKVDDSVFQTMKYEGIDTIIDFINLTNADIDAFEYEADGQVASLPKKDKRKLKQLLLWARYLHKKNSANAWTELTDSDFDVFMADIAPTLSSGGAQPSKDATSSFQSSIKLDVKLYPIFDGKVSDWLRFKRGVLSIASTHGLDCIFDAAYKIPAEGNGQDWQLYQAKNKFVYSIWTSRIHGSYPLTIVRNHEATKDGRAVYQALQDHYESKSNLEQARLLAMNKLQNLSLEYKSSGDIPSYVAKFRDSMLDLKEAGKPLDPLFQKSLFLSKIKDREYSHLVDACTDDNSLSLEDCITKFESRYTRLHQQAPTKAPKVNNVHKKSYKNDKRNSIPKEEWTNMTQEQRSEYITQRRARGWKPKREQGAPKNPTVPKSNYTKQGNIVHILKTLAQTLETEEQSQDNSNNNNNNNSNNNDDDGDSPDLQSILRSQLARTANHVRVVRVSARAAHHIQVCQASSATEDHWTAIDSGADTSLLGSSFHILEEDSTRVVTVHGFNDEEGAATGLHIGSGICAIDVDNDVLLLQVNEGVIMPKGKSLLSSNQMRAHGHAVNDAPKRYGGQQSITMSTGNTLPLRYRSALCMLSARKPTQWELENLEPLHLTSPAPWNPALEDDRIEHDESPALETHQLADGGWSMSNKATKQPEEPDWERIRQCLGYKPEEVCKKTMEATTQLARHQVNVPMKEHYKARFPALNVRRLNEVFATDTFFSSEKAIGGFSCAQIYVGKTSYLTEVLGMHRESSMHDTLTDFIRKWGAPSALLSDNARTEIGNAVKSILRKYNIKDLQTEPHHPNQNPAERRIQEVKKTSLIIMDRSGAPSSLWYLALQYTAYLLNRIAHPLLNNRMPIERCIGETPDISALLQFHFYQPVFYYEKQSSYPRSKERLGWWVGVAENTGDALTYNILTTDNVIIQRSVCRAADNQFHPNLRENQLEAPVITAESDVIDAAKLVLPTVNPADILGKKFIKQVNGHPHKAEVVETLENGKFLVKIGDGDREDIMAYNEILDHFEKSQDDAAEDDLFMFDEVIDHRLNSKGKYEVLIQWDTGEETWEPLDEMIKQDAVTMAKYAVDHNLLKKTQWKKLKKNVKRGTGRHIQRIKLMARLKKKAAKFKFGVQIPNDYEHGMELDKENGDKGWYDANDTEMEKMNEYKVFVDHGKKPPPPGYKKITVHTIFDVKYDGRKRARLVAGGHLTDPTHDTPYNGIASLKNIRICIFIAKLNGPTICAVDVGSAYLEAYTKEKLYIVAGPEFREKEGNTLLINKALYGLRTSGGRWAERLADVLTDMGWQQSRVDAAIWMNDCGTHYEYICVWVDDLLIMSKDPMTIVNQLKEHFTLKGVGEPEYFLGADMKTVETPEKVFTMGSGTYIKKILEQFERAMGYAPPKRVNTPLDPDDHPELDTSELLNDKMRKTYWSLMGMLQWAVTLGRIDIHVAVMTMARFRMEPRVGHLKRVERIFGFLRNYKSCSIKFRTDAPDYLMYTPMKHDWTYVYGPVHEELPHNMPEARGYKVIITVFYDANLYHCRVSGRAVTGIIILLNKTPIDWISKRQGTVETATYGSEFVAARIATDNIVELRYTLRMLGVEVNEASYMFGDNKAVVDSSSIPEHNLKKRHNALSYHRVREAVAAGIIQCYHIDGKKNPADVLTKFLSHAIWWPLMKPLLHWLPDSTTDQSVGGVGSPPNKGKPQKKEKRGDRPQADDGRQTGQANALSSLNHVTVKQLTVNTTVKTNFKEEKKKTKKRTNKIRSDPLGIAQVGSTKTSLVKTRSRLD